MRKDPTEFRKRFAAWKNGKQPYKGGRISDEEYVRTMEKVAADNWRDWQDDSEDAALTRILNSNEYNYRQYYNDNPTGNGNANDHWTDKYKTVWHPSFSDQSIYSGKKSQYNPYGLLGGTWQGEFFTPQWYQQNPNAAGFYKDGYPKIRMYKNGKLPGYYTGTPWGDTEEREAVKEWVEDWKTRTTAAGSSKVLQRWNATGSKPKPESSQEYTKRRVAEETKMTPVTRAVGKVMDIPTVANATPGTSTGYSTFGQYMPQQQSTVGNEIGAFLDAVFAPQMPGDIMKAYNFVRNIPKKYIAPLEHIDFDRFRTAVAKLKSDDDVWRAAHPEMEIENVLKRPKLQNASETIPKDLQKYEIDPVTQKLVTKQESDLIEKMLYENKGFHGKQISNLHDNRARINGDFVEGVGRVYNVDDPADYEAALQWLEDNAFGNRDGAIKFLKHPDIQKSLTGYMLNYKDKPIFISKSQLISRKERELGRKLTQEEAEDLYYKVASHERHHAFDKIHNAPEGFDLSNLSLDDYFVKNGFDELAARGTQLKDMYGLVRKPLTAAHLRHASGVYFMDPSNLNNNMTRFFNLITDYKKAAKWLNENATGVLQPIAGVGIGSGLYNKYAE